MTIGGTDCGVRQPPAIKTIGKVQSWGVSQGGTFTKYNFGTTDYTIPIHFKKMASATALSLQSACNTAGRGGSLTVALDTGDDLGVPGLTGSPTMYLVDFRAEYIMNGYWDVVITLRYVT